MSNKFAETLGNQIMAENKYNPPEITPESRRVWEDPDPRVKWALDILDPKRDYMRESLFGRLMFPALGGAAGFFTVAANNKMFRLPRRANIFGYIAVTAFGFWAGESLRKYQLNFKSEELAVIKHYIMLHPDRFPEPEPMKIGDKRNFYEWLPNRRGDA